MIIQPIKCRPIVRSLMRLGPTISFVVRAFCHPNPSSFHNPTTSLADWCPSIQLLARRVRNFGRPFAHSGLRRRMFCSPLAFLRIVCFLCVSVRRLFWADNVFADSPANPPSPRLLPRRRFSSLRQFRTPESGSSSIFTTRLRFVICVSLSQ